MSNKRDCGDINLREQTQSVGGGIAPYLNALMHTYIQFNLVYVLTIVVTVVHSI
jgi:hypothetical protein